MERAGRIFDGPGAPLRLYLLGVVWNLAFLATLAGFATSRRNLHPPEGQYAGNRWSGTDVLTYVRPARELLASGIFSNDGVEPDYHRTVGYPAFLAVSMLAFGEHWLAGVLLAQALLFALAYPAVHSLAASLFPDQPGVGRSALTFLFVAGTYWAQQSALLTDLMCAVCLNAGLACGLLAVLRRSWPWTVVQVALIGYASQVRPSLVLYAPIHLLLLLSVARRHGLLKQRKAWAVVASSVLSIALLGSAPALRNLANHGYFHPSDAFEVNLFKQLGRRVTEAAGAEIWYQALRDDLAERQGFRQQVEGERQAAVAIVTRYPLIAARIMAGQAFAILTSSHWLKVANLWNYHWRALPAVGLRPARLLLAVNAVWVLVYLLVHLLATARLVRMWRGSDRLLAIALLAFFGYLLVPSFTDAAGSRMRLPVEGLLVLLAASEWDTRRARATGSPDTGLA
jgi:hypothetical protein